MKTTQEIRETILTLLKNKNITANKMLMDCGCSKSLLSDLQRGQMPSADKLAKIARYLEVSTDYLLENTDDPTPPTEKDSFIDNMELSEDIKKYVNIMKDLSEKDREAIYQLIDFYSSRND